MRMHYPRRLNIGPVGSCKLLTWCQARLRSQSQEPAIFGGSGAGFKISLEPELVVNLAAPAPGLICALTVAMFRSCYATI